MDRPRHVLIIVENLPVPFDARVWQESLALKESGYEVSVICPRGEGEYEARRQCIQGIRIFRHDLPLEAKGFAAYVLEYLAAIYWQFSLARRVYRRAPFQAIQACNPPDLSYLVALFFKLFHRVRFVFDHHDLSPELYRAKFGRKDLAYKALLFFERRTFAAADRSIATNESYRRVAMERDRMPPERITVVRSGPSLERMYPVPPNQAWKRGRKFLVAYVGVIGKQEGLEYLLRAVRAIRYGMGITDIQFIVVGRGPDLERVKGAAKALGVADMVEFTGRVPDETLREILSSADACVNPDEYNEMNDKSTMNKVMEYMAMGKAIVQFDLREGRASALGSSLYCARNDHEDLAAKLVWLMENGEERERMGRMGRERVLRELAWRYEKPKYVAVYDALLPSAGG